MCQLWMSLPRTEKMTPPTQHVIAANQVPVGESQDGRVRVKIIAGESRGQFAKPLCTTPFMYLHFTLQPGGHVEQPVPANYNVFAYVMDGEISAGPDNAVVSAGRLALFASDGNRIVLSTPDSANAPANVLVLGGVPLNEPIKCVAYFVMNTDEEIAQAFQDWEMGRMGQVVDA